VKLARNPDQLVFAVPALRPGDRISARQKWHGILSAPSPTVIVRDWHVDYPGGLPAPTINPDLIYECADIIAVAHVPGAKVTVTVDGGSPVTTGTATGWTGVWPGVRPFVVGNEFKAQIQMCPGEPPSPWSAGVRAVPAPATIPPATFVPARIFAGQELISLTDLTNGSHTKLMVSGMNAGGFTTPISWFPNYDLKSAIGRALNLFDSVSARQGLCEMGPITTIQQSSPCTDLPAPRIEQAIPGARFVIVADSVPGARVRVYDASGAEIGDGSGSVILLSRPLVVGDMLTVVQQVGECTGLRGHRMIVQALGQ